MFIGRECFCGCSFFVSTLFLAIILLFFFSWRPLRPNYQCLALHFTINDVQFAEASVDRRMLWWLFGFHCFHTHTNKTRFVILLFFVIHLYRRLWRVWHRIHCHCKRFAYVRFHLFHLDFIFFVPKRYGVWEISSTQRMALELKRGQDAIQRNAAQDCGLAFGSTVIVSGPPHRTMHIPANWILGSHSNQ